MGHSHCCNHDRKLLMVQCWWDEDPQNVLVAWVSLS